MMSTAQRRHRDTRYGEGEGDEGRCARQAIAVHAPVGKSVEGGVQGGILAV